MRLDDLPGELIMWILIASEVLVFGAGLSVMTVLRLMDAEGFAAAQAMLDGHAAAANTLILVTSGWFAARAERAARAGARRAARVALLLAMLGGVAFLVVKGMEYGRDIHAGIGMETHVFFTFYYLLTGFHAAHVLAGIFVLALVSIRARHDGVQAGVMFWHMVDLVWVLILPPIYLLG